MISQLIDYPSFILLPLKVFITPPCKYTYNNLGKLGGQQVNKMNLIYEFGFRKNDASLPTTPLTTP